MLRVLKRGQAPSCVHVRIEPMLEGHAGAREADIISFI